jgi:ubiquinone/menaquinone biosynthesis C-methylase UbiE
MSIDKHRICPVENARVLDSKLRKLMHNPRKILKPYLKPGMVILDLGTGPGFFALEMARLVGESGKVIAADLQDGMLEKLRAKIRGTDLEKIITLRRTEEDKVGLEEKVDFVLVFYVLHEVPDQEKFLEEIKTILKPDGKALIVEPTWHVSKKEFENLIDIAKKLGFEIMESPKILFSRAVTVKMIINN